MDETSRTTKLERQAGRRLAVRRVAAALCVSCAVVYFAIGLGLVHPAQSAADAGGLLAFGAAAGLAFALGAVLLARIDRLGPWILGAVFQALVIVAYFAVAETRTPPFEGWGIALKITQVAILAALVFLIVTPGGRCPCAWCHHHRDLHRGRCRVPGCSCEVFL
jgi:hypothetical protein